MVLPHMVLHHVEWVMNRLMNQYEDGLRASLTTDVPDFRAGDGLRVHVKVKEGERERVQIFEGVCIARRMRGIHSSFTVRKVSYGEGVERVFPLHSPRLASIEVVRHGKVRRAKLYYLRGLSGRKARIEERKTSVGNKNIKDVLSSKGIETEQSAPVSTEINQKRGEGNDTE